MWFHGRNYFKKWKYEKDEDLQQGVRIFHAGEVHSGKNKIILLLGLDFAILHQ